VRWITRALSGPDPGNLPIPEWIEEERPREALIAFGTESLSLSKLFAIILRTGRRGVNAEELSRRMLNAFSGLRGIDAASLSEICAIKGIGRAKAAQVKAALEIGKRFYREHAKNLKRIESPRRAFDFVASYYGPSLRDCQVECACLILLDRRRALLRAVELQRGGDRAVEANLTQILREAVRASASSIILVHNHPSGDGAPSTDDLSLTRSVRDACGLFGIRLLDHVIIGKNRGDSYSFARHGLL
jgi:DNA repair protein RadC